MKNFFNEKVVVITGSSMGIGKSLAQLLGSQKAKIVMNARNAEKLADSCLELQALGYNVIACEGDVTLAADCTKLIDAAIRHFGKIDILVNNAGVGMRGAIATITPGVISSIFNVNAIAPILLTQVALPHIKESKGSIIFISSLAGLRGLPFLSIYSAAKMSLTAFAQALRAEHHHDKIHIGLVYVGITQINEGKTAIGSDGKPVLLAHRKEGILTETIDQVAVKIASNISSKKKQTIIGLAGKAFYFLIRYTPGLFEFLLLRSQKRINKLYK